MSPKAYEKMRDSFIREGLTKKEAQEKAAKIYNSRHNKKVGRKDRKG